MSDETRTFEELIGALEERVRRLETGELELVDALKIFEEGIELTRDCHERLDAADRRLVDLDSRKE